MAAGMRANAPLYALITLQPVEPLENWNERNPCITAPCMPNWSLENRLVASAPLCPAITPGPT